MLSDIKKSLQEVADAIEWKNVDKNELCRRYVVSDESLKESYLSAIILKYWGHISTYASRSESMNVDKEDVYNWLVDSILYVLDKHRWDFEDSSIYNDPNGPDKAINRKLLSVRKNEYISYNRDKRFCNAMTLSSDGLEDDSLDYMLPHDEMKLNMHDEHFSKYIADSFNKKLYLKAFLVYIILNYNVFDSDTGEFSIKKTVAVIHDAKDEFCEYFSINFNLDYDKVKKAHSYVKEKSTAELDEGIKKILTELRHDSFLKRR